MTARIFLPGNFVAKLSGRAVNASSLVLCIITLR